MQTDTPIDIVYLWVNGDDPAWRRRRTGAAAALSAGGRDALARYANVEGRFRDNDELRYSLRALERFFPAHGHVYIVTDAQTPAWLRPSDRVTLVDHRDLIPGARLPTFDSGNIESYIHRISALSERYFYLNDDVFFGAPVHTGDWFFDQGIYVNWSGEPPISDEPLRADATALENACRLSSQWFKAAAGPESGLPAPVQAVARRYQHRFRTFAHSPRPMLRSVLFELERVAPEMFEAVRSTVFRSWDKPTIVSDFVMRWALATGMARLREHSHLHVSTGDADLSRQLDGLLDLQGRVDFFCVNDTTDDAGPQDRRLVRVHETLEQMFPLASRFERSDPANRPVPGQAGNQNARAMARALSVPA